MTCQADWIHLTNNPIGPIAPISPIGPIFHPLLVKRIQNAIALAKALGKCGRDPEIVFPF